MSLDGGSFSLTGSIASGATLLVDSGITLNEHGGRASGALSFGGKRCRAAAWRRGRPAASASRWRPPASGVTTGTAALGFVSHDAVLADLAVSAGTVAVSGTVDNFATIGIENTGGTLTHSGNSWTLDLGSTSQTGAALTGTIGVANLATGLADLLGGSSAVTGSSNFTNSGFTGGFAGLGAGQDDRTQTISLSNSAAGTITETIVVAASGTNRSGYNGALANQTITVRGTVAPSGQITNITDTPTLIVGGTGNDLFNAPSHGAELARQPRWRRRHQHAGADRRRRGVRPERAEAAGEFSGHHRPRTATPRTSTCGTAPPRRSPSHPPPAAPARRSSTAATAATQSSSRRGPTRSTSPRPPPR